MASRVRVTNMFPSPSKTLEAHAGVIAIGKVYEGHDLDVWGPGGATAATVSFPRCFHSAEAWCKFRK